MKKDLLIRLMSAIVFVVILSGGILFNKYLFVTIFSALTVMTLFETYILIEKYGNKTFKIYGVFIGIFIFILSFFSAQNILPPISFATIIILIIFLFIFEIYRKNEDELSVSAFTVFGIIYVAVPFSTLNFIAFPGLNEGEFTYKYLLSLFAIIWINDTGAYLIGSKFGKHKLFESISPKKTWEGIAGGAFFALIATYVLSVFFKELNLLEWFLFALITIVFGTFGDLAESRLKRKAGLKDSGSIMPGHGGFLDRFDSTLFAAPIIFIYLKIIEIFFV